MTSTSTNSVVLNSVEIEYITLLRNRLKFLGGIIYNEPFLNFSPDRRFYIIKELYNVYTELYSMSKFNVKLDNPDSKLEEQLNFQKDLIKMIRNVLSHFPFFDSWNEVYLTKELVTFNVPLRKKFPNSAIHRFFTTNDIPGYAVRVTEMDNTQTTFLIRIPQGYDNNEKIYLKDIIEEQNIGKYSVHLIRLLLNGFLREYSLHNLIIPRVETVED